MQLTSDTALARKLRREVMVRLSRRGNEVGFSGGNVMRMDVSYFDFSGGNDRGIGTIGGQPGLCGAGRQSAARRCRATDRASATGWRRRRQRADPAHHAHALFAATAARCCGRRATSCATQADKSQLAGEAMIDTIFDNADKNRIGDAGCPL